MRPPPHQHRRRCRRDRRAKVFELARLESRILLSDVPYRPMVDDYINPTDFTNVNGTLYFVNEDGIHGSELWRTDGTQAGTRMVKDIWAGRQSGLRPSFRWGRFDHPLFTVNNTSFFIADDGVHGEQVWKTDGSGAGTVRVSDASQPDSLTVVNGAVIFRAGDGRGNQQLWRATPGGSGATAITPADGTQIGNVAALGNTLYYLRSRDSGTPAELWRTDGTAAGSARVAASLEREAELWAYAGQLFVGGYYTGVSKFDFTTKTVRVLRPGGVWDRPVGMIGSKFLFYELRAEDPPASNPNGIAMALWATDGTAAGTVRVWAGSTDNDSTTIPGTGQFTIVGGKTVYIRARDGWSAPAELWKSDGTPGGTALLKRGGFEARDLSSLVDVGGTLYFVDLRKLWKSDATAAGTVPVADFAPHPDYPMSLAAADLTNFNGTLFFRGTDPQRGVGLWRYKPAVGEKMVRMSNVGDGRTLSRGVLTVLGLGFNDVIRINASAKNGTITVYWNDAPSATYKMSEVTGVLVDGYSGDDRVTLSGPVPRATLLGGAGHDTLVGGDGADVIVGDYDDADNQFSSDRYLIYSDYGNDSLVGGGGNDTLRGLRGNDSLYGQAGDDSLVGGLDSDWLEGDVGNDALDGGEGRDVLNGGAGDDLLYADNDSNYRDYVNGGSGMDRARVDRRDVRSDIEALLR